MRENHHQQVIEVVGDTARKPPYHLHFLDLAYLFFEALAARNVAENSLNDSPSVQFCEARIHFDGDRTSVSLSKLQFLCFDIGSCQGLIQYAPVCGLISRLKNVALASADD